MLQFVQVEWLIQKNSRKISTDLHRNIAFSWISNILFGPKDLFWTHARVICSHTICSEKIWWMGWCMEVETCKRYTNKKYHLYRRVFHFNCEIFKGKFPGTVISFLSTDSFIKQLNQMSEIIACTCTELWNIHINTIVQHVLVSFGAVDTLYNASDLSNNGSVQEFG